MKINEGSVACHVCNQKNIHLIDQMKDLPRAASDCRPWKEGGLLGVCETCGVVQKMVNKEWREETCAIYDKYNLYHQSGGIEQPAFNSISGEGKPRSQKILETLKDKFPFLQKGRMLDVGCGTGSFLTAFSSLFKEWELNGLEPNVKTYSHLISIPNVKEIYSSEIKEVPGTFDLISVMHALEHIENPLFFLQSLRDKFNRNGLLLIQVPYFRDNPFDLIIADHCSHFTCSSLASLMKAAGFEIIHLSSHVISKEITVLAKPVSQMHPLEKISHEQACSTIRAVEYCVNWLEATMKEAYDIERSSKKFGIFGTSISANWLLGFLGDKITFFVDEDKARVGRLYREKPVYLPQDIPSESDIFMPLPNHVAHHIAERNHRNDVNFRLPPHFNWPSEDVQ